MRHINVLGESRTMRAAICLKEGKKVCVCVPEKATEQELGV